MNVNKVATVRNSRGGALPSVVDAARVAVRAGAGGVTVHPRADQRHVTPSDVRAIRSELADHWGESLEFNIEGDPRDDWMDLVCAVRPAQATLVPVTPGEVTSHAGFVPGKDRTMLESAISRLHGEGIRVSLFVDPDRDAILWAKELEADRVELYTEPFARAYERGPEAAKESFSTYAAAARLAHAEGLGINAGHDLDLENLVVFRDLPHLDEVSIGHAIVSRAIFVGLETVIREYLAVIQARSP